jgi:IPT/TIG domain
MQRIGGTSLTSLCRHTILVALLLFSSREMLAQTSIPCSAEPTDMPISYAQVVNCEISPVGDFDSFRFTGSAGQTVRIQVTRQAGSGSPYFEVYDPNNVQVTNVPTFAAIAFKEITLTVTGSHTIRVYDFQFNETFAYQIVLQRLAPPLSATPLTFGQTPQTGEITYAGDVDFYTFAAEAGQTVRLQVTRQAGSGSPYFEVYDPNNLQVTNVPTFAAIAFKEITLTATGTHTIRVYDFQFNETFAYQIVLQRLMPPLSSIPLTFGQTPQTGDITYAGDVDFYTFAGEAGQTVRLQVTRQGGLGSPYFEVYDPNNLQVTNVPVFAAIAFKEITLTVTGTHTIRVYDFQFNETFAYQIVLQRLAPPLSETPLTFGQTPQTGDISYAGDVDFYTFAGEAGQTVRLQVTRQTGSGSPYFEVYDPNNVQVTNVPTFAAIAFKEITLTATGTHTIRVYDFQFDQPLTYQVFLQCVSQCPGPIITLLSPDSIREAEPDFTLTLTGVGFQPAAVVHWGGSPKMTTLISGTQLAARILTSDVRVPGTVQVTVVQDGVTSNTLTFTITADNAPPVVTQVLPRFGPTVGNTRCIILGDHFKPELATRTVISPLSYQSGQGRAVLQQTGEEGVFFGGVRLTQVIFVNRTRVEGVTPPNPPGTSEIRVVQTNGSGSLPDAYTYKTLSPVPPSTTRRVQIPFVVDNPEFRTNLGINNLAAQEATVQLLLADNNGLLLASKTATVPAHGMRQINHVIRELEEATDVTGREAYLLLDSPQPIGAWASQVDNLSLDPSLELGRSETQAASRVLLPSSVASNRFQTSLIVVNTSERAGQVAIRARDGQGSLQVVIGRQPIEAKGYIFFENFYEAVGLSNVFGPIELEGLGGIQIQAIERIYSPERTSGYFEGIDLAEAATTVVLPFSIDTEEFRTNLGVNNLGAAAASVKVSLIGKEGQMLGTPAEITVPPQGMTQINNINQVLLRRQEVTNEEGTLRLESDQPILAWSSQIDNQTQDPSLVVGKTSRSSRLLIPSTTSTGSFRSTLAVVNLSELATTVELTARGNDGAIQAALMQFIPGRGLLTFDDIRASLNLEDTFGPLELRSLDDKLLLAVSRVASTQRTGGYFEGVAVGIAP